MFSNLLTAGEPLIIPTLRPTCARWNADEVASMYNFTNRMSLACGMIPNEEYHALAR
jgi:hypothetical protein